MFVAIAAKIDLEISPKKRYIIVIPIITQIDLYVIHFSRDLILVSIIVYIICLNYTFVKDKNKPSQYPWAAMIRLLQIEGLGF